MNRKRLFYDIETSFCQGSFWRPGYNQTITPEQILRYAQIICVSWKWEGEDKIHHLDWGLEEQCDKKLLQVFIEQLDSADEIVAHNGDRFDIKWIRARAAFHGIDMRPRYQAIDTYKLCKKYLALPSYKLGAIANYYSLESKKDPGGLQTWIDVIVNKKKEALERMLEYCDGDIITLEAVFNHLRTYFEHSLNYAALHDCDKFMCPECSSEPRLDKTYTTKMGVVRRSMRCKKCKLKYTISNKTFMKYLEWRMKADK